MSTADGRPRATADAADLSPVGSIRRFAFPVMGTMASLALALPYAEPPQTANRTAAAVRRELVAAERRFSRYLPGSELQRYRRGEVPQQQVSADMREVLAACGRWKAATAGAFRPHSADGRFDPTGYVKGWAIQRAVTVAAAAGAPDVCLSVGGDVQCAGAATARRPWRVAVRDPVARSRILAIVEPVRVPDRLAVATSGTYERGAHLWLSDGSAAGAADPISVTVFGADAAGADACATAVWARCREAGVPAGMDLLQECPGVAGIVAARLDGRWSVRLSPAAPDYLVAPGGCENRIDGQGRRTPIRARIGSG